jgi:hypothetical protein
LQYVLCPLPHSQSFSTFSETVLKGVRFLQFSHRLVCASFILWRRARVGIISCMAPYHIVFRTHDLSRRAAADLRLRPRGHWDQHMKNNTIFIISRSVVLRMRNISYKLCRENPNTHLMFRNLFSNILPLMRNCGENIVDPDRPQMTIRRMRITCFIPKATNTHSAYVILIAIPLHQWFAQTPLIVTLYVHCLSCFTTDHLSGLL